MGDEPSYEYTRWDSVEDVLDFAMGREEESAEFYADLAGWVERPSMREMFGSFAREEEDHRSRLRALKEGKAALPEPKRVQDLKIADYLVDEEPGPKLDYQQALILAMKKEKASFKLYSDLAERTDQVLRSTFLSLAQEEARHKLRVEMVYDEEILKDN